MKTIIKLFFFYGLLCNTLIAKENEVVDIRLSSNINSERIVIETTEKVDFNAFVLDKPFRLVVDIKNTSSNLTAPSFKADKIIDTVRMGKLSEIDTRLAFDISVKTKIANSFYLSPTSENQVHRIVIDLTYNEDDLQREDIIGKLIEANNLYDVEPNVLNNAIDDVLTENSEINKDNSKILAKIQKRSNNVNPTPNIKQHNNIKDGRQPRIIIDAGHGGKDPGTIGLRGTKEKIITLLYAKSLKEALDKTNKYKVYLTRNQDFFVELRERISIARRYKGDLFISFHADSTTNTKARGFSMYTLSQQASDTRTAQLAQKENKADILGGLNLYGEYQDTINTLVDISRRQAMNDSNKFARILETELKQRNVNGLGEMVKHANFAVLTSADMPSILLEVGFLSNDTDERMVRSFGYKTKIINSVVHAINVYFKK